MAERSRRILQSQPEVAHLTTAEVSSLASANVITGAGVLLSGFPM